VIRTLDFSDDEWSVVRQGMYNVVYNSTKYAKMFADCSVQVAGKTGTAQEDKTRGNHANFVSFAPYNDPEISVSVSIPFGYTAANAVSVASDVMKYYFGDISLESIMQNEATQAADADANE
jgi:penicillin-binding protein 2